MTAQDTAAPPPADGRRWFIGLASGLGLFVLAYAGPARATEWLVDVVDTKAETAAGLDQAPEPLSAPIDLGRLRLRVETVSRSGHRPEEVLVADLVMAHGSRAFPAGLRLAVHVGFLDARDSAGHPVQVTLTAHAAESRAGHGRRTGLGVPGRRAGVVVRFDGLPGLGDLSSTVAGRSVTFRAPLRELHARATAQAGRDELPPDGEWELTVWASAVRGNQRDSLPEAVDREGIDGAARLRVPRPDPEGPGR